MITAAQYLGKYEQVGDDHFRVLIQLTDDLRGVGQQWFDASGSTTAAIRDDISRQIAAINDRRTEKAVLDGVPNGTNIPVTAPAAAAQTALQIWTDKARRLTRLRAMGTVTGALAAAITALQADVDGSYQAGFESGV